MDVKKVGVVGAGVMGHGIGQICAMSGLEVYLVDISNEILEKAMEKIKWSLNKLVEKGKIGKEEAEASMSRIKPTTRYEDLSDIDLAIEAVPERMNLKKVVFQKLDEVAPEEAILTSNTSSLSITEISKTTRRPEKVAGMHFFNPPQIMALVEVIKGDYTSEETIEKVMRLARSLGKTPVLVKKDERGFIVNRILGAVFSKAFWDVHLGRAEKEEVDAAAKYGAGLPMGLFELADYIGLDVLSEIMRTLSDAYGDRLRYCPIMDDLISQGKLGRKTGKGFYDWSEGRPSIPRELEKRYDASELLVVAVNEAAWIVMDEVAEVKDVDTAMKLGAGWPKGPLELADEMGIREVIRKLELLLSERKEEVYRPCPILKDYVKRGWLGREAGRGFYVY
ncbi:MAG: 3-hydroxybutyryl-CoA dehydrogenase [Thermoproteota archaeon]|nr:MAG: 3-hydroxybutyryl-CoA dehydrogenase [Candidatus Korarchaeota archaeon]